MSELTSAQRAFLAALNDTGVEYLVIGGHAVIAHGCYRPAHDLDIWTKPSEENIQRIGDAIHRAFGMRLSGEDLARLRLPTIAGAPGRTLRKSNQGKLKLPSIEVEILSAIPPAPRWKFDDCARRAARKWYQGQSVASRCARPARVQTALRSRKGYCRRSPTEDATP